MKIARKQNSGLLAVAPFLSAFLAAHFLTSIPGCSEKVEPEEDAHVVDGGPDSTLIDAFEPDAGSPPGPCRTEVLLLTDVEPDPLGPDTQIHASVCFDGEALWAAYSLPNSLGLFDVWATRVECNGETSVEPFQLGDKPEQNETAPRITCASSAVFIAWGVDTGAHENNMEISFTSFTRDGIPIIEEPKKLETTRQSVPVTRNMMYPVTAAIDEESIWLAGVRGIEETGTFHVFLQEIDLTGNLKGEAHEPVTEPGITHLLPALSISPSKDIYLSWNRFASSGEDEIFHTVLKSGSASAEEPVNAIENIKGLSSAYWAGGSDGVERAVLAVGTTGGNILLTNGDVLDPSEPFVYAGDTSEMDHSPALAGGEQSGMLAFYRNISGLRNMVIAQPFRFEGREIILGEETMITEGPAAPYSLSLTYVGENIYFAAWSEGISPEFRIKGRFFRSEQ